MWLGIIAGLVVVALLIAGASLYILNKSKKWTLTAPPTVAGLPRDTSPLDQAGFGSAVTQFKANITRLPDYGQLKSTVSGIYTMGSGQILGFVGFNGTFKVQVVLKSANGLRVQSVSAGPHGGAAECGISSSDTICQWSTGTTVGIVLVLPVGGSRPEPIAPAASLMLRVRDSVEHPAKGS